VNISVVSLNFGVELLNQRGGSGPLFCDCGTNGFDGE
jgi:hypothetical protein